VATSYSFPYLNGDQMLTLNPLPISRVRQSSALSRSRQFARHDLAHLSYPAASVAGRNRAVHNRCGSCAGHSPRASRRSDSTNCGQCQSGNVTDFFMSRQRDHGTICSC
jgi:hypothetical protein